MLTQKRLKEVLDYSPSTGEFKWLKSGRRGWAGKTAGGYSRGYRVIRVDDTLYFAHHLAWLYMYGVIPDMIDHINRVKDDNRIANLRLSDKRLNSYNRGLQTNNTSGITGVSWSKNMSKWEAYIWKKQKKIKLGYFADFEDAVAARAEAECPLM